MIPFYLFLTASLFQFRRFVCFFFSNFGPRQPVVFLRLALGLRADEHVDDRRSGGVRHGCFDGRLDFFDGAAHEALAAGAQLRQHLVAALGHQRQRRRTVCNTNRCFFFVSCCHLNISWPLDQSGRPYWVVSSSKQNHSDFENDYESTGALRLG